MNTCDAFDDCAHRLDVLLRAKCSDKRNAACVNIIRQIQFYTANTDVYLQAMTCAQQIHTSILWTSLANAVACLYDMKTEVRMDKWTWDNRLIDARGLADVRMIKSHVDALWDAYSPCSPLAADAKRAIALEERAIALEERAIALEKHALEKVKRAAAAVWVVWV